MIIIFIEHYKREYFIASELAKKCVKKFKKKVVICSLNFTTFEVFSFNSICFIITPNYNKFVTKLVDKSKIPLITLNYEQMLSPLNRVLKTITYSNNKNDIYLSWSKNYTQFLLKQKIPLNQILSTSRPQDEISSFDYNVPLDLYFKYYHLLKEYAISNKVVFVPLTCLHAFKSNNEIKRLSKSTNADFKQLFERRDFVKGTLLNLYKDISVNKEFFFIVRPHPGVSVNMHKQFLSKYKIILSDNVLFTSEYSAYNWMALSNIVLTNYSSLALDSKNLGIQTVLYNVNNSPDFLKYDWFEEFVNIDKLCNLKILKCDDNHFKKRQKHTDQIIDFLNTNRSSYFKSYSINFLILIRLLFTNRFIANLYRTFCSRLNFISIKGLKNDYFKKNIS